MDQEKRNTIRNKKEGRWPADDLSAGLSDNDQSIPIVL